MLRKVSIFLIAIVLLVPRATGQSTFGGIVGVVKDPSQSAVPNAQLTLTSLDDRSQRSASTDNNGGFEFINLKAGHYELEIRADGFADYKVESLQLDARQSLRLDVSLKLAGSTQTIEVNSEAGPVIDTENGTIGDTKDFQQLTGLPVNYRGATTSPLAMLATVPGAQQDANGNVSVGGGLPSQVQYSVDGSSTVNIRQNGALGNMNPSSELISEFKVTQFNNNAEFAQLGDVTISTKSGGDQFHGSAFEYLQNNALDASVWNSRDKPHKALQHVRRQSRRPAAPSPRHPRPSHDFLFRGLRSQSPALFDSALSVRSHQRHAARRIFRNSPLRSWILSPARLTRAT